MLTPERFANAILKVCLLSSACVSVFNYVIDPYNQYGRNFLGIYTTHDRASKASAIQLCKHNAVILGNSREGMIPPRELGVFQFFNAAFGGGTSEEIFYFIKHFVKNQELVLLGIDYGQGDPSESQGDLYSAKSLSSTLDDLLNLKTTENSLKTVPHRIAGKKATFDTYGTFNADGWFKKYDVFIPGRADMQAASMKQNFDTYAEHASVTLHYYEQISQILQERNIPCIVFVPPLPAPVAEHLRNSGELPKFKKWEADLNRIFPYIANLAFSEHGRLENFFSSDIEHLKPQALSAIINAELNEYFKYFQTERTLRRASNSR